MIENYIHLSLEINLSMGLCVAKVGYTVTTFKINHLGVTRSVTRNRIDRQTGKMYIVFYFGGLTADSL